MADEVYLYTSQEGPAKARHARLTAAYLGSPILELANLAIDSASARSHPWDAPVDGQRGVR